MSTPGIISNPTIDLNAPITDFRALNLLKAMYGVKDVIDVLSIGHTRLYEAIAEDELHPVKFGSKTLFFADDLANFLRRLRSQHDTARPAEPRPLAKAPKRGRQARKGQRAALQT
jgi:hypothetical protein